MPIDDYRASPDSKAEKLAGLTPFKYAKKYGLDYLGQACKALMTDNDILAQEKELNNLLFVHYAEPCAVQLSGYDFKMLLESIKLFMQERTQNNFNNFKFSICQAPSWFLGTLYHFLKVGVDISTLSAKKITETIQLVVCGGGCRLGEGLLIVGDGAYNDMASRVLKVEKSQKGLLDLLSHLVKPSIQDVALSEPSELSILQL